MEKKYSKTLQNQIDMGYVPLLYCKVCDWSTSGMLHQFCAYGHGKLELFEFRSIEDL